MWPAFCSERLGTSLLSCPACRGQGSHVRASHLCTYACTHVHTVNVLSSTNLRHPGPEGSKEVMGKGWEWHPRSVSLGGEESVASVRL